MCLFLPTNFLKALKFRRCLDFVILLYGLIHCGLCDFVFNET